MAFVFKSIEQAPVRDPKQEDQFAVWPDGTECSMSAPRDLADLLTWKSDDYEIKTATGYDETNSPIF